MYRIVPLFVVLAALLLAAGCQRSQPPTTTAVVPPPATPAPEAAAPETAPSTPETAPPGVASPATPATPPSPAKPTAPAAPPASAPAPAAAASGSLAPILAARKQLKSYEILMPGREGRDRVMAVKLKDGKLARMRLETPNGFMLMLVDKQVTYLVDTQAKTALKRPMEEWRGGPGFGGRFDPEAIAALKPKVSATQLEGLDCWLVEWTDREQTRQVWVDKQYGLPRQFQTPQGPMQPTYRKINAVPDSTFELPSGLTIREAPAGRGGWGPGGPGGGPPGAPGGPRNRGEGGNRDGGRGRGVPEAPPRSEGANSPDS